MYSLTDAAMLQLGQVGSVFLNTDAQDFEPSGVVVVAITMLTDVTFDFLTPDDTTKFFGMSGTGFGSDGDTVGTGDTFPKGVTIYGRWTKVNISASEACICYVGP